VALFRAGHDDAFRVIHDRYRQRLFAYTRQMLSDRQDAEDALQDIFVRAYAGLRANDRELALRAWLYRVAHNRCIDELRRPAPPPPEVIELLRSPVSDPIAEADRRESLRSLIADVRRLPDQQRSALLMRELGGMSYADLSAALGVTVPAVKSLLVRARLALGQAVEARDTACSDIREELIVAHDRGLRPNATARRHMHDCAGCREFRHDLRGVSRRFAALVPLGPLGVLANLLGAGGAGTGAAGAAGAASSAVAGAAGTGSGLVSAGAVSVGATHVATLLAAAVVTAGGAVEIQHTITTPSHHHPARAAAVAAPRSPVTPARAPALSYPTPQEAEMTPGGSIPAPRSTALGAGSTAEPGSDAVSSSSSGKTVTSTSTATPVKLKKLNPTGGSAAVISVGGVAPTVASGRGTGSTSTGTSSSSNTGTGTGTGTGAGTGTGNATSSAPASGQTDQSTQTPTGTSTTPSGSTTQAPSTTSSTSAGSSQSGSSGSGSSSTTTTPGGSSSPTQ
jgi:RNA polymerase sigma factor (sigma-70 family)